MDARVVWNTVAQ